VSPRSFGIPQDLTPEEERAILSALERHLLGEAPPPEAWAMAGRLEATGQGALQARRAMRAPWRAPTRAAFARWGAIPFHGRGDAH